MGPRIACLMFALVVTAVPRPTLVEPVTGLALVEIPAGRFVMGSPPSEPGRNADEVPHTVTIGRPFLLGRHEVTQHEWRVLMNTSPSAHGGCDECPVERVDSFDVQAFLDALNRTAVRSENPVLRRARFRLPTEAEWEYACRAGTTTPFSTGRNLTTAQANYNGRFPYPTFAPGQYRGHPTAVESFAPNAWGLYDMHGNVWEWTSDGYGPYGAAQPGGADTKKVIRGGSWYFDANSARCALRYTHRPQDRGFSLGFRVAADVLRNSGTRRNLAEPSRLLLYERVLHLIHDAPVLDRAAPESRLEDVTGLLEHATRRDVPGERHGVDARQAVHVDRVARDRSQRLGGDPSPPERLADPVADLGGDALDVGVHDETDAAHRGPLDGDGKGGLGQALTRRPDELLAVVAGIRVGKRVAQVQPDPVIVRVGGERIDVGRPPRSHGAAVERELHRR
jgi:formylglycine-generating enzyme required for sulfatase activity